MAKPKATESGKRSAKARPFQGRLLRKTAAAMDPQELAIVRNVIEEGFATGRTTESIVSEIWRKVGKTKPTP